MAPIDSDFKNRMDDSMLVVVNLVLFSVTAVAILVIAIFACGCCGKKKPQQKEEYSFGQHRGTPTGGPSPTTSFVFDNRRSRGSRCSSSAGTKTPSMDAPQKKRKPKQKVTSKPPPQPTMVPAIETPSFVLDSWREEEVVDPSSRYRLLPDSAAPESDDTAPSLKLISMKEERYFPPKQPTKATWAKPETVPADMSQTVMLSVSSQLSK